MTEEALGAVVSRFLPGPEPGAEVAVEAGGQAHLLGDLQTVEDEVGADFIQGRGDAGDMEPVEALQKLVDVHLARSYSVMGSACGRR